MSLCRVCDRPVVFAKDSDGKWQVLDPTAPVYRVINTTLGKATCERDKKAFVSHWVTCAKRDQMKAIQADAPQRDFHEPKESE